MQYDVYERDVDDLEGRQTGACEAAAEAPGSALLAEFDRIGLSLIRFSELAGVPPSRSVLPKCWWVACPGRDVCIEGVAAGRRAYGDHRCPVSPAGDAASQGIAGAPVMLSFTGSLMVFVALEPCDMRKGFEGLTGFVGERYTGLKVLYSDGTGLWLMIKRLEAGTFSWAQAWGDSGGEDAPGPRGLGYAHR